MRDARNARERGSTGVTGVSSYGGGACFRPIGAWFLEDQPGEVYSGVDFNPRPETGQWDRSIDQRFLHRVHTLLRVLMWKGISGAFTVSFRFFSFSLSLFRQFQPTSLVVLSWFASSLNIAISDIRNWVRSIVGWKNHCWVLYAFVEFKFEVFARCLELW